MVTAIESGFGKPASKRSTSAAKRSGLFQTAKGRVRARPSASAAFRFAPPISSPTTCTIIPRTQTSSNGRREQPDVSVCVELHAPSARLEGSIRREGQGRTWGRQTTVPRRSMVGLRSLRELVPPYAQIPLDRLARFTRKEHPLCKVIPRQSPVADVGRRQPRIGFDDLDVWGDFRQGDQVEANQAGQSRAVSGRLLG